MFEAISVSKPTRKPWTVALSFVGQGVMAGLAILIPLVHTQALPHGGLLRSSLIPGPPRGLHPHEPRAHAMVRPVRPQFKPGVIQSPRSVPHDLTLIADAAPPAPAGDGEGIVGGVPGTSDVGNVVIDNWANPPQPPPPPPALKPQPEKTAVPRIKIGGQIQEGKLVFGPPPVYPIFAKTARVSGVVRLQAVIAVDGSIIDLRTLSGPPMLISAALAAVKQWRFRPTYLNGDPVEVATEIDVRFVLQQ
jgi:protein TonB